jgi:hypothetical protein
MSATVAAGQTSHGAFAVQGRGTSDSVEAPSHRCLPAQPPLPLDRSTASDAWLALAAITHNPMRAPWPPPSTPRSPPAPCATNSYACPPGSPAEPDDSHSTCRGTGPGTRHGSRYSPRSTSHPTADAPSDLPARARDLCTCGRAGQTSNYRTPVDGKTARNPPNDHTGIRPVDPGSADLEADGLPQENPGAVMVPETLGNHGFSEVGRQRCGELESLDRAGIDSRQH